MAVMILVILATLAFGAVASAFNEARIDRTRAIVGKIDQLIMEKYESYRTRAVPIRIPPGVQPRQAALARLAALRELMRMEMPQHRGDVFWNAQFLPANPALWNNYNRRLIASTGAPNSNAAFAAWSSSAEGSECLYLILAGMRDGERSALDFFSPDEIRDTDGDLMLEIVDAWGMPINFIRTPYGYSELAGPDNAWGNSGADDDGDGTQDNYTEAGWLTSDDRLPPPTPQTRNARLAPDPFDPLRVDGRWTDNDYTFDPFALKPLIYSAGTNKIYEIQREDRDLTDTSTFPNGRPIVNDPYVVPATGSPAMGTPYDADGNGDPEYTDNITNHDLEAR